MPKITQLPVADTLTGNEILPVVQSGLARSVLLSRLLAFFSGVIETRSTFTYPTGGLPWLLNGGNPVNSVSKIYMNGVLQDNADFDISLPFGAVIPLITIPGVVRIDIFWF